MVSDPVLDPPDFYQRTLLTTPTYEGSGQATHPSVVKIDGGWNGWLYWMAMTPYPNADNTKENPSILVSNDGETWEAIGTNPVIPQPASGNLSDPDLVFYDDILHMFYRLFDSTDTGSEEKIFWTYTADGTSWSTPEAVLTNDSATTRPLSPAVLRGSDGTWRMWTIDIIPSPNTLQLRTASIPEGPWSAPLTLDAADREGRDLWHIDISYDGGYRMFLQTCVLDDSGGVGRMLLGSSQDGESWSFSNAVLSPSGGSNWDGASVYRQSGLFEDDRWRVWYGGVDSSNNWRIGYTEADPLDFPGVTAAVGPSGFDGSCGFGVGFSNAFAISTFCQSSERRILPSAQVRLRAR